MKALLKRFEPASKQNIYMAELNSKRKKTSEDWATFGEDLRTLAEKAYPDLEEAAHECLALNKYLERIDDPQLSFAVRQKQPKTVDDAVQVTIELHSYLPPPQLAAPQDIVAAVDTRDSRESEQGDVIAATVTHQKSDGMGLLLEKLERMEADIKSLKQSQPQGRSFRGTKTRSQSGPIVCRKCGVKGHFDSGCAARFQPAKQLGNDQPSQQ